jgi:SAM-dependent methyltransferase
MRSDAPRRAKGGEAQDPAAAWDRAARRAITRPYLDPRLASAKRAAYVALLDRWLPAALSRSTILKTDLWEEGVAGDELLFTLAGRAATTWGIDVSPIVVDAAARGAREAGMTIHLRCADVRSIPIASDSVDVVISTSTLDHLETPADYRAALAELRRVVTPEGLLILTLDNAENALHWLLCLVARLGIVPFPLGGSVRLAELERLVASCGFEVEDRSYLVPAPRVLTTACVRLIRLVPGRAGERALAGFLDVLEAVGRRFPRRTAAFVAIKARALPPSPQQAVPSGSRAAASA